MSRSTMQVVRSSSSAPQMGPIARPGSRGAQVPEGLTMSRINHPEQLRYITEGRVRDAVAEYLSGDWSRRGELFDLPRSIFDDWVDSLEGLPGQRIHLERATFDGIYVVRDSEDW